MEPVERIMDMIRPLNQDGFLDINKFSKGVHEADMKTYYRDKMFLEELFNIKINTRKDDRSGHIIFYIEKNTRALFNDTIKNHLALRAMRTQDGNLGWDESQYTAVKQFVKLHDRYLSSGPKVIDNFEKNGRHPYVLDIQLPDMICSEENIKILDDAIESISAVKINYSDNENGSPVGREADVVPIAIRYDGKSWDLLSVEIKNGTERTIKINAITNVVKGKSIEDNNEYEKYIDLQMRKSVNSLI